MFSVVDRADFLKRFLAQIDLRPEDVQPKPEPMYEGTTDPDLEISSEEKNLG